MTPITSTENPALLNHEQRGIFYRAYWWHRVIGGTNAETAAYKAFAQALMPIGNDTTTLDGERMYLRERVAVKPPSP